MRISDWSSDVCSSDLLAGYEVVVIDPRKAWASAARFPGVRLVDDWPDAAMTALAPDHRSAVVLLTHDPTLDDPALRVAMRSPTFYVVPLDNRNTHACHPARLTHDGLNTDQHAPIH